MNESTPTPPPEISTPAPMSLGARLTNVFVSPGEVFDAVKVGKPDNANWLAPLGLACVLGVIFTLVVFSQDTIVRSLQETQEKQIQKKIDAGKMTKEQGQQALEAIEKFAGPAMIKITGSIGAVVFNFIMLFFVALVLWLMGKWLFKARFSYMQAVEVSGLATMISVVGGIVTMLLIVAMGNLMATPGPALFIRELSDTNTLHQALSAINVATLWYIAVLAIGLARLSGASVAKAALWLYGLWAVLVGGMLFVKTMVTGG